MMQDVWENHFDALTPFSGNFVNHTEQSVKSILNYIFWNLIRHLCCRYEMFFDDALEASNVMEITLTGKSCGLDERAPMCGVPYHAVDTYINKLSSGNITFYFLVFFFN